MSPLYCSSHGEVWEFNYIKFLVNYYEIKLAEFHRINHFGVIFGASCQCGSEMVNFFGQRLDFSLPCSVFLVQTPPAWRLQQRSDLLS